MDNKCDTCKWFEPFNGVCFNGKSKYCADMPWQYNVDSCDSWEENDE